ncbi:diaminopimelate epimerase [Streptomyces monomycini]|uniref:diaminopimelate epimerase n=1 Tax=Streptomyces monomycini TaxID=371720 RepID=UPI0007C53564|nr:diaminopimelate epimerase [Streptomyces monomycini]
MASPLPHREAVPDGHDFVKYEALGNDYLVITPAAAQAVSTPENIRLICDRHHGPGADGILYGPLPAQHGFGLRTFNSDGSECEKSGNGLRIFGRYLSDYGWAEEPEFTVHTPAGPATVELLEPDSRGPGTALPGSGRSAEAEPAPVRVSMGRASLDSELIGATGPRREMLRETLPALEREWTATCVFLGNPHCVVPLDGSEVTEETARRLGPALVRHERFPQRVNVQLMEVRAADLIRIECYERGAGYTLASGSSACAAAVAAHALGLTSAEVTVEMPGGTLGVGVSDTGEVTLTGPVRSVVAGRWTPAFRRRLAS